MKFPILENLNTEQSKPPTDPPVEAPIEAPVEPEPKQTIPFERLKGIIDRVGCALAKDKQLTIDEKIEQWIDLLKWALPLVPDDRQHFKAQVRESIENPTEKDFISERTLKI